MAESQVKEQSDHNTTKEHGGSPLWQRVLIMVALLVGLQMVFLLSNVCAVALPKDAVRHNIESPANAAFLHYRDYSHKVLGSCVSFDNNGYPGAFANQDDYDGDVLKAAALNKIGDKEYFRYWHGWQLPIFLILSLGDFEFLAVVLGVLALGASAFFFWQLRWYLGWLPAGAFTFVAFFSTNILGNFMGDFLLCLSLSVIVLCCAFALKVGRNPKKSIFWQDCICLVAAALFCFFDFFTIPAFAIALVVFSGMIASGCLEESFKSSFGRFVRFTAIFLVGFVFTWASKWMLASAFLGLPTVFGNVFNEMDLWAVRPMSTSQGDLADRFPRLFALIKSSWFVLNSGDPSRTVSWNVSGIAGFILFVVGAAMIMVAAVKAKNKTGGVVCVKGGVWGLLLPSLLIPAGIVLLYHHVLYHAVVFGYKPWAFFLADVATIGLYLFCANRPKEETSEVRSLACD